MKTIKIKLDKKDCIKSMFNRTIIFQKSKIQNDKKKYKREKFNYIKENFL
jgi:hypothetical protein